MRRGVLGALLVAWASAWPAQAAPGPLDAQVGLYRYHPPTAMEVSAAGAWTLGLGGHQVRLRPGQTLTLRAQGTQVVATRAGRVVLAGPALRLRGSAPWQLRPLGEASRAFDGTLDVRAVRGTLLPVLSQDLEAYVRACAGDEMPPDWPSAALEAQAIASRSYASAQRGRHRAEGFDYCDLTHCQRYRGLAGADARVASAVAATRERVLTGRGRTVETPWHAACGGWLAPNEVVFGGAAQPHLRGGYDGPPGGAAWCREARVARWTYGVDRQRLEAAAVAAGLLARGERLADLTVRDRTSGGYATSVRLEGAFPRALTGYALWMALGPHFGWGDLKSPAFGIRRAGDRFRFEGHGLGHGVGMCQWGARGQALAGRSAAQILAFYYPGTVIR